MISIDKFKQFTLVLFLALAVHACGFHLRGSISVTDEMAPVYMLQNNSFELAREIKSLLSSSKIKTVDNADAAKTRLVLVNETKNTRVLSVDGSGQAQQYLLTYTINITIKVGQEKEVADTIAVRRDLNFNSVAVLGFTNEAKILYKDMRKQAARLILLKLQARSKDTTKNTATSETEDASVSPDSYNTNNISVL